METKEKNQEKEEALKPSPLHRTDKSQAREFTLKTLYEKEFNHSTENLNDSDKLTELSKKTINISLLEHSKSRPYSFHQKDINTPSISTATQNYAHTLLNGIKTNQKKIDSLIKQTSQSWKMERISLIDLNIMRIAVYEMLCSTPPVPFKVCINEAVEMAKIYGTENSTKFINGILDTLSKRI